MTTYATLGNITSVLNGRSMLYSWLYNNFVQLSAGNLYRFAYQKKMYFDCPFLESWSVPVYLVRDLILFIRESIKNGMYLFFPADRYYLNGYDEYRSKHLVHEVFVYGFDDKAEVFYTADNSINRKYADKKISYSDLAEAYFAVSEKFMNLSSFKSDAHVDTDMQKIKSLVCSYVNSERDYNDLRYSPSNTYGVAVYEKYVNDLCADEKILGDFRPLSLFFEHKKLMLMRIEYLYENGFLACDSSCLKEYGAVVRKFLLLRNLQLRFSVTRDKSVIKDICTIKSHADEEVRILRKIFMI